MSVKVNQWLFEQLTQAPGKEKKSFTLAGANAPHGRPRQKAIFGHGVEVREQTIRYPGSDIPTRHIFGNKYEDWELSGRFRDTYNNLGGAKELVDYFEQFVADGQTVRISWGD